MDLESDLQVIAEYVEKYRSQYNITPTYGAKLELSCLAFGEGHNLLYRQLIPTTNGDGYWDCLDDPQIRQLVLDEIIKAKKQEENPR